jgi:hypothetical protein
MYAREMKASLYIRHSQEYCERWVTNASIVDVTVQLHLDMAKGDSGLMYNGGDLIHDYVNRFDSIQSVPAKTVILSCFSLITIVWVV